MFARGPSWLCLPTRCRRHREPSRRLAAPGTLPSRSLPEIGHLSRRPAVWLFLRIVADVFTCGIIRASQEAAVLTDLCLQPAVAVGAGLNGQAAVAAAEGAVCLERQSLSAKRARSLHVPAIGPVRAAVEGPAVLFVLASLEPSLDAFRAGDRRSTRRRFPPLRNSSRPDCHPLEPQNSLALAGQRLTESQRRCVEVETEALRSLRVILQTNLAMTPDP